MSRHKPAHPAQLDAFEGAPLGVRPSARAGLWLEVDRLAVREQAARRRRGPSSAPRWVDVDPAHVAL
jgi:hypothetical protein